MVHLLKIQKGRVLFKKKMKNIIKNSKGFTLIELLVVIAIIAVLAVAVILTLNPAELLKQARDSTRISDLSTINTAISLYLADVTSPKITIFVAATSTCSMSVAPGAIILNSTLNPCVTRYVNATANGVTSSSQNAAFGVDGTGWVPVNFTTISSGAPLGNLPRDPTNTVTGVTSTNLYYSYVASSTSLTFELNVKMESTKYASGVPSLEANDGGDQPIIYEQGTNLRL